MTLFWSNNVGLGIGLGAIALAGCSAQATPDYPGEKLSAVQGVVVSELTQAEAEGAVVLANWGWSGGMFAPGGTVAEIEGEFPAQFQLALYEPPPDELLYNPAETISFDGVTYPFDPDNDGLIALARIVAVGRDESGAPDPHHVLGASEDHALLYAQAPIEDGSLAAAMFHATLPAGYHLVEVRELDPEEERAVIECEAAAEDLDDWHDCGLNSRLHIADPATEITVRLAPEGELVFPSYYPVFVAPGTNLDPSPMCAPGDPMDPCQ